MLYFTRWRALGIILTALVVCLCAVPNFFPEAQVKTWPAWAQRRLVLGLDLQGGSYLLLEVDSNYVKKEKLEQVRDEDVALPIPGSASPAASRSATTPSRPGSRKKPMFRRHWPSSRKSRSRSGACSGPAVSAISM